MLGKPYDPMLKAFTGLEGGLVASGSTCGVVTGGAAGIAMMNLDVLSRDGTEAEAGVMSMIKDYMQWFGRNYGSCLCRQRTDVDFQRPWGQVRYLFPGDKVAGCMWHISGAVRYLHELQQQPLPDSPRSVSCDAGRVSHCATTVLAEIEKKTGLADDILNRIAFVFDGGVGLSGGICGALVGAILGINLKFGMDIRNISYLKNFNGFIAGHLNLLRKKPPSKAEPFSVGNNIVQQFINQAGSVECATITGQTFSDYPEFCQYIDTASTCRELMDMAAKSAVAAIEAF